MSYTEERATRIATLRKSRDKAYERGISPGAAFNRDLRRSLIIRKVELYGSLGGTYSYNSTVNISKVEQAFAEANILTDAIPAFNLWNVLISAECIDDAPDIMRALGGNQALTMAQHGEEEIAERFNDKYFYRWTLDAIVTTQKLIEQTMNKIGPGGSESMRKTYRRQLIACEIRRKVRAEAAVNCETRWLQRAFDAAMDGVNFSGMVDINAVKHSTLGALMTVFSGDVAGGLTDDSVADIIKGLKGVKAKVADSVSFNPTVAPPAGKMPLLMMPKPLTVPMDEPFTGKPDVEDEQVPMPMVDATGLGSPTTKVVAPGMRAGKTRTVQDIEDKWQRANADKGPKAGKRPKRLITLN